MRYEYVGPNLWVPLALLGLIVIAVFQSQRENSSAAVNRLV